MKPPAIDGVHLCGSVPLNGTEQVLRTVAGALGPYLARLPDGETGPRRDWIAWQYAVLVATPGLEPTPPGDRPYLRRQLVRLTSPRVEPSFGALGYAEAALASYPVFARLQGEGVIPEGVRFQVSLPTPLAPLTVFVEREDRPLVEPGYEAALLAELGQIVDGIPHDRLAIQWDVAVEVGLLERVWPAHFADVRQGVLDRLAYLAEAVPGDVPMGFHLCYGDFGHRHFTAPADAATLVWLADELAAQGRPIAWVHLPIPAGWTEPPAYAPLARLRLAAATHVYLGLLHASDGLAGARRRVALASQVVPHFGVATECGWGRRPAASLPALLELHAAVAARSV